LALNGLRNWFVGIKTHSPDFSTTILGLKFELKDDVLFALAGDALSLYFNRKT